MKMIERPFLKHCNTTVNGENCILKVYSR